jgi:hypothetical protein
MKKTSLLGLFIAIGTGVGAAFFGQRASRSGSRSDQGAAWRSEF